MTTEIEKYLWYLETAHKHCFKNREELENSEIIDCFHCGETCTYSQISEWVDFPEQTAMCPHCAVVSLIGSASGFPINKDFLDAMNTYWFSVR